MKKYLLTLFIIASALVAQKSSGPLRDPGGPRVDPSNYSLTGGRTTSGVYTKFGTGTLLPGGGGSVNSGTANQIAYYATSGTAVSGDPRLIDNGSTLTYSSSQVCTAGNGACPTGSSAATAEYMVGAGVFTFSGLAGVSGISAQVTDSGLRVYVMKFQSPYQLTFSTVSFWASNNTLPGGDVVLGLYSKLGVRLWTSPTQHVPNTSGTQFTISSIAFSEPPGAYYLAWTSNSLNTSMTGWDISSYLSPRDMINLNSDIIFGSSPNAATQAGGAGTAITLPATLGALTATAAGLSVNPIAPIFQP